MTTQPRRRLFRIVDILAIVMLVLGVLAWVRTVQVRSDASDNVAVVDKARTSAVIKDVSKGLASVLSYSYDSPASTKAAAARVLTDAARKQQQTLFAELRKRAPHQKLVLSATVQAAGVTELDSRHATLLVFLDQSSKRASDKQATISAAQLVVKATRVDGTWKISSLQPL